MAKLIVGVNDLATVNPDLAAEWHPTKNGDRTPTQVTSCSGKKVWWLGKCGHEWEETICHRSYGGGCPYCATNSARTLPGYNDLATVNPELAAEWHPTKNGALLPSGVKKCSVKTVWWLGKCGHEWQAQVCNRSHGTGCPVCKGKKVLPGYNDLATVDPVLAAEWHPTKNGDLTPLKITPGSNKKVWWQCSKGHEWQASVFNRSKGVGCPYCSGRIPILGINDLATVIPGLAAEWHPTKNGKLLPSHVSRSSGKKVWWQCEHGHEWQAVIAKRSSGQGCPVCYLHLNTKRKE